jgi:hypothetical protein
MILKTISTKTPRKTAEAFRLLLATEKGFTSTLTREGRDYLVTASDGRQVLFVKELEGLEESR